MIDLGRVADNAITLLVLAGFFWLIYQGGKDQFSGVIGKVTNIFGKKQ